MADVKAKKEEKKERKLVFQVGEQFFDLIMEKIGKHPGTLEETLECYKIKDILQKTKEDYFNNFDEDGNRIEKESKKEEKKEEKK